MVTGAYDAVEAAKNLTNRELENMKLSFTEACHIVPFSLGSFSESEVSRVSLSGIVEWY